MRFLFILLLCITTPAIAQEPQQPLIWHIPVMPVLPPAPVQPPILPPVQPQPQRWQIQYPTPIRSFFFGRFIIPVQPPPTAIRTPINE
jgi:hypothetical protein